MILINDAVLAKLRERTLSERPFECCGLLFSEFKERDKIIDSIELHNLFRNQHEGYAMDQNEFLDAVDSAERVGKELVGIYHSHPNGAAVPSDYDRLHAWPNMLYFVVGLSGEVKAWRLKQDRSGFDEVVISPTT